MHTKKTSHAKFNKLPVVDISGLYASALRDRQAAAVELDRAARDAGFLFVVGHRIPEDDIQALISSAKAYFAQSEYVKRQNYIGYSKNHSGYVPMGEERFYGRHG